MMAPDVVDLLLEQHERVRQQFILVLGAVGKEKLELFAQLVEMLHRHEKIEQEMVHPAFGDAHAAAEVVDDVIAEERAADRTIAELTALGVDSPEFDGKLADFHAAVLAHAAHEEEQEFPLLRSLVPMDRLQAMASEMRVAQATHW